MVTLRTQKSQNSSNQEQRDDSPEDDNILLLNENKKKNSNSYYYYGYIIIILIFLPITLVTTIIGDYSLPKNSEGAHNGFIDTYISIYERKNYYTESFALGKFIQWNLMCISGFLFVTIVNLRNERRSPFLGRYGDYSDFIGLVILVPLIYFTSPLMFMRSYSDMQRDCSGEEISPKSPFDTNQNQALNSIGVFSYFQILFHELMDGFSNFGSIFTDYYTCHPFTFTEVFGYNYMVVIFFFLGCNMTHMGALVDCVLGKQGANLSLSMEAVRSWGLREILAMIFFFSVAMGYLTYMLWLYAKAEILMLYGLLIVFYLSSMILPSFIMRKTHTFHLHHYAWGAMYMTLAGYQHPFISICASIHSGIMVEGVARWGFDKWWYRKEK